VGLKKTDFGKYLNKVLMRIYENNHKKKGMYVFLKKVRGEDACND